jgi:hypothetical protein
VKLKEISETKYNESSVTRCFVKKSPKMEPY